MEIFAAHKIYNYLDTPALCVLGGQASNDETNAKKYIAKIYDMMPNLDPALEDINVYAAQYSDPNSIHVYNLFYRYGINVLDESESDKMKLSKNAPIPNDAIYFYNAMIKPRISYKNKKINISDAISNMRRLIIFTDCYGGTIADFAGLLALDDMHDLKYKFDDAYEILKSATLISRIGLKPISHQFFREYNFWSTVDDYAQFYNYEYNNITKQNIQPCIVDNNFIINAAAKRQEYEHAFMTLITRPDTLTTNGKIMRDVMIHTLGGAINYATTNDKKITNDDLFLKSHQNINFIKNGKALCRDL